MQNPKTLARSLAGYLPPEARSMASRALRRAGGFRSTVKEPYELWRSRLADDIALTVDRGVAFAGCGLQARNIAAAWADAGGRVAAAFDVRAGAAESFLADFGSASDVGATFPAASPSLEALLQNQDDWSALVVATTAGSHVDVALAALEAGVGRLLVEKPVATAVTDARSLLQAAQSRSALVAVNHTRRWLPSAVGLRRLIDSSAIGEVRSINFMWGRNGFAMIGSHLFDFARMLTGSEIEIVQCQLDDTVRVTWRGDAYVDQPGFALARMADGTRVSIDLSGDLPTQQGFMVIVGETGRLEVDEPLGRVRLVGRGRRVWETTYGFSDMLALGSARAVAELLGGAGPACDVADGLAALEAVIACQVSSRNGGTWVSLPLEAEVEQEVFPFA